MVHDALVHVCADPLPVPLILLKHGFLRSVFNHNLTLTRLPNNPHNPRSLDEGNLDYELLVEPGQWIEAEHQVRERGGVVRC